MFKLNSLTIFIISSLLGAAVGQILEAGQCNPNIALVNNFNIQNFVGTWYEIQRSDSPEQSTECAAFSFTQVNNVINVQHNGVNDNFAQGSTGTATLTTGTAQISLNINNWFTGPMDFWVLATDYQSYAVTYACENVSTVQRRIYLWVLGRQRTYASVVEQNLIATTINNLLNIQLSSLKTVDHSDTACYTLPVIPAGQAIVIPGQCDANIPVQQNFNVNSFTGTWHQIADYYTESSVGNCARAQYTLVDGAVSIINSEVINQQLLTITGTATVSSTDNSARLRVILNLPTGPFARDLWVISTDYNNYAISYSCENVSATQKRIYSWILSRTRTVSAAVQASIDQVVSSVTELNYRYFTNTDQTDAACFYLPEPTGQPVQFPGQCDTNIAPMANFNAAQYLGLWYDVESYPAPFQTGSCSLADYSLNADNTVRVENSQVINQGLETWIGSAVPATDGTGSLDVTFIINGTPVTSKLWVLATDYTSYSYVYSCENVGNDARLVYSWKLSRTPTLTAAAITAINGFMNTISVLDQRYYVARGHTEADCLGGNVIMTGQCSADNQVLAVTNFNTNAFSGTWYEISRFPSSFEQGDCVASQFTLTGANTFSVTHTAVNNERLNTALSQATAYADGRGVLSVNINGVPFNSIYILATDYTDYALAYACRNVNAQNKQVYSWKLSRSASGLSQNANTAINQIVNSNADLSENNYKITNRDNDACFYYPVFDQIPSTIELPGPCPTNIRGVPNFNAANYLGTWYETARYPAQDQSGQCSRAEYSPGDRVIVYNTEVVNQQLRTQSGFAQVASTDGSGVLDVEFVVNGVVININYYILATDYTSYSLVYSCSNLQNGNRRVASWKLSRSPTLSAAAAAAMAPVIASTQGLLEDYYMPISQSAEACFYFPEPTGQPVQFPGQCDTNIAPMANFNAAQYLGLWYDVESYPAPFQTGSCSLADYSLNADNTVRVENSQVNNQSLETWIGSAVPATDGTGSLDVTFIINGIPVTSKLWVLATDYTSYSYVYSCENVGNDARLVYSWKLSRTPSLTAAAITAINGFMNTISVLDQRYYVARGHTQADCLGGNVILTGQCTADNQVLAVTNFNTNAFSGTWYEISRFPSSFEQGDCVANQFTLTGANTFSVTHTAVNNERLNTALSQATVSADGRGALSVNINGVPFNSIYILATDYTDYALAYACRNVNAQNKQVYSWKLSRSASGLSQNANTAINQIVNSNADLSENNYKTTNRDNDACFYYPVFDQLPSTIELPGPCPTNIRGVPNFNAANYLGTWYETARYPAQDQSGQCSRAEYSPGDRVIVYNTEVVNQQLRTQSGFAQVASTDGSGVLDVEFVVNGVVININYYILATDYTSYSLVYSCSNLQNGNRRVASWKLSRTPTLSAAAAAAMAPVIASTQGLLEDYYMPISQSAEACFYFPEPTGQPVQFPGQCDTNIAPMANFNAAQYLGLWYDVESYPAPFQTGSCSLADYSLNADNTVRVENSQVNNQSLETWIGSAVPATDGTGSLDVTFIINGIPVTSKLWVLATDYTSYSYVYSCENVGNDARLVYSWKLSRTPSLTAAAITAINGFMNTISVLDQRYYVARGHTQADCLGGNVILTGQCTADNQVLAVTNFNTNAFSGTWYEISRFPSSFEQGDCVANQFTLTGANTFSVTHTAVNNERLNTALSQATVSADGRGALSVNINGVPFNSIYILATDYTDYALAYACRNVNAQNKQVYSWKLSRSASGLSQNANTAINQIVNSNADLSENNYKTTNRDNDACFYYPVFDQLPSTIELPGPCPTNIRGVPNFNAANYLGTWYETARYPAQDQSGQCSRAEYSPGDRVIVYNTEVVNQQLRTQSGFAQVASTDGSGVLDVEFVVNGVVININYYILATDYTSYSLVYSCSNLQNGNRRVASWKLSRTPTLSAAAAAAMAPVIASTQGLLEDYYMPISQSAEACFYFPEPTGQPVQFPGQCDTNIAPMANFNAAQYLGLWYDVESYPAPFQTGSCSLADYSLNADNTVRVENSQVNNQSLDTWIGSAVPATDGTGSLDVTFIINGIPVTSKLWVLATDYTSYSYVYSCENVGNDARLVYSWKLSRTPSLTAAAITAINGFMNTINVLDQRYYVARGHTEADCLGGNVILTGQCTADNQVLAVTNFNTNAFSGTWYEISRFPSSFEQGDCVANQFTLSGANTFSVTHTAVNNERLNTALSQATASADGRGVLSVNINGVPFNSIYILATDYTDYALAYACRNVNAQNKQVYSWKLSRSASGLSQNANTAINQVVNSNADLSENNYKTTNRDNDACFYYPVFDQLPSTIELPGPCPTNIRGVPNFNAANYLGTWYETARYPAQDQSGQCSRAEYSPGDRVIVYNTEVVNQQLRTQSGFAQVASTDGSGVLDVEFVVNGVVININYYILATDYTSYSLVYSCSNLQNGNRRVASWKLSRSPTLSAAAAAAMAPVIASTQGLLEDYYMPISQSAEACFYFPEPTGQPVQFPGQCDTNIAPMANFNAAQYLGLWYDVESYPAPFQTGSCSLADYSLNADNTVRVENSQVNNQSLETWIGSAVPATDGTGSLDVTFIINGIPVTSKLWVLATDYTSYSYVYSCENVGNDARLVYSWKLSRTPTLTAAAITAINGFMNTISVLDQRYYVARGHTEADCLGGNVILTGQCTADNQVLAVTNFNTNAFSGTWYEISRFPSSFEQGDCVANQFTLTGANTFSVTHTAVNNERLSTALSQATASANGRGVLSVNINGVPFNSIYILATDYTDYALAYACRNVNAQNKQVYSWKLSKSASGLSQNANTAINQIINSNADLSENNYKTTNRDNDACFYYPVFDQLPSTIELPGPCPTNIRGVPNFNAGNYLGTWYETARYPAQDQSGQCSRAEYSPGDRVIVYNTEVVNQQLRTQSGFAQVASTDGSGVLDVEFVVNGVVININYYILATDYTSYSLVYSCSNLQNGNRRVASWKLSRSPTLSAAAATAMAPVIASTQGLLEDYYMPISQTAEACFYIPEVNATAAPLFRGQCETMTGIAGFNVQRYLGVWNELERYPIDGNAGQCRSSQYTAAGTTYTVVDTQIENNQRTDLTGNVTISNTGRIQRVMADGTTQDIWVLATDYDNYALLYSCENVGTEYRRVWSAKHSKARSFSAAAETAMNTVINNNIVLYAQFYQQVSQTNDACFYYPTITQGQIIIPGQCDASIPVVQNFNNEQFAGDWYHIERYDDLGGSTCIGSRYTVNSDAIRVLYFEVSNNELQTLEGSARVTSTNGAGVLELMFPVGNTEATTTTTVSILATDYTSYALAYSCVNVGTTQRQVRAWKLSREQTMSTAGTTAINALIQARQELHQPYFKQITQQEDCPKPSSAFIVKSSIIILLVCALLQRLM